MPLASKTSFINNCIQIPYKELLNLPNRPKKLFSSKTEFDFQNVLGQGSYGKVYQATHRQTSLTYAIKVVYLTALHRVSYQLIEKEITI